MARPARVGAGGGKSDQAEKDAEGSQAGGEGRTAGSARRDVRRRGARHQNPAWICKFEREQDAEAFAEMYGTNDNKANASGSAFPGGSGPRRARHR